MRKSATTLVAIALAGCSAEGSWVLDLPAPDGGTSKGTSPQGTTPDGGTGTAPDGGSPIGNTDSGIVSPRDGAAGGGGESDVVVQPPATTTIVVDSSSTLQTMDGFGASESWVPTITDAQADLFFSTTNGIGLSILRLGIAPDGTLYSGSWGTAQKAVARNSALRVWGAPWSPPASDKTTNNTTTGSINPTAYASWASTLAGFVGTAKANGVVVSGISAQNEPDFNTNGSYDMCLYDQNQMASFVAALGPALSALSPPVQLLAPESSQWGNLWGGTDYVDAVMANSTAAAYVSIIATHQYGVSDPTSHAIPAGKRLWETEVSDETAFDPSIGNAVTTATWIHNAIVDGGVNAWHYWWLVCQGTDNEGLIGQRNDGTLTKRVYAMGNFSRFIRPGWVRLQTTGTASGLLVTAYKDPASGSFAVVAVNTSGANVNASFGLDGPPFSSVSTYVTSGTPVDAIGTDGNLSPGSASGGVPATIAATMNTFAAQIPAGVTTFVGSTM